MILGNTSEITLSAIKKFSEKRIEELTLEEYEALSGALEKLMEYSGSDRVISNKDYWIERGGIEKEVLTYHPSIWNLDNYTKGFELGELWNISGPAKHGKTTLCETIGHDIFKQGGKCLWFFFEMPDKFLARNKDVDDVFYIPRERVANNLEWIESRIIEAKLKNNITTVFIDHLHYIVGFSNLMHNASISIGHTMRFLKNEIAVKLGLLVFLVAHTTKINFTDEPNESDIRDSSFVAQESDGTIMVYRRLKDGKKWTDNDPFSNKSRLIVCNARRSGAMHGKVNLVKEGNYLYEESNSDSDM
jgi:replicative DNA helicase